MWGAAGADGAVRLQLATLAETMPEVLDDLVGPPLPPLCERAWEAFTVLSATRTSGGSGANPITYVEIAAYQAVTGVRLTTLELACVRAGDYEVMRWQSDKMRADVDGAPSPTLPEPIE